MAFQTSVLRNGQWVTETVNDQAALRRARMGSKSSSLAPAAPEPCAPALSHGIVSTMLVDSPVVRRILPVRLRSEAHNDMAFIGERHVHISELRSDGSVDEMARYSNFGSRIRNCAVLGHHPDHGLDGDGDAPDEASSCRPKPLPAFPPQLLVLMLESGDVVFTFLRQKHHHSDSLVFVWSRYTMPRKVSYLGHHLAIDPSSRYMAAASPDGLVIYELEDMATLAAQYASSQSFSPVKSIRARSTQAVIHSLQFLYPKPQDDYLVMLLLVCIRKERMGDEPVTRIVTYEWERGDSLSDVFASEKPGHRLPQEHKLPLLVIPLRFNYAFFTISEASICMVNRCLSGSPVFESLHSEQPQRTRLHQGPNKPLWTAWARPFRRKRYFDKTDIIYLAREDGAIIHIEIEATDLVPSVTNVGYLDANIDSAFATAYDVFSDILIVGGDSGPGGIWKLAPRTDLEQVSLLPNWSPVVDIATIPAASQANKSSRMPLGQDRVFSASGRGLKGSVTEWRLGMQARIGLEIEFDEPVKQIWLLEANSKQPEDSFQVLMALPSHSVLVNFRKDFAQVDAVTAQDTELDLAHRTLDVCHRSQGSMLQVTEASITLVAAAAGMSSRFALQDLVPSSEPLVAACACSTEDAVVLSTYGQGGCHLHTLLMSQGHLYHDKTWEARGHVTCVCQLQLADSKLILAASTLSASCLVSLYSLNGEPLAAVVVGQDEGHTLGQEWVAAGSSVEALTGFCRINAGEANQAYFASGTRCGCLLCIKVSDDNDERITCTVDKIGVAPLQVSPACHDGAAALLCCDDKMIMATNFCPRELRFRNKDVIWLTDASDAAKPSPPVHLARFLGPSMSGFEGRLSLMLQSRLSLILAELWPRAGLVPRSMPLGGTPTRIIYSHTWGCLVVGLVDDDRSTLAFVDTESGATISRASDKYRNQRSFMSGLGQVDDRIYSLYEWTINKDGTLFSLILVGTQAGRLLVVSVERIRGGHDEVQLQYWTRYKKMFGHAIYSMAADDVNIVFCAGKTIYWESLGLEEKKLMPRGQFTTDSPATSLRLSGASVMALTTSHSLEIISLSDNGRMELVYTDKTSRKTIHMTDNGMNCQWPLVLLSEQDGGVAGIWIPWRQSNRHQYNVLFEAKLPTSIRRFASTHGRPIWQAHHGSEPKYGTLPGSHDGADILGFALDGSLQHLTLVKDELWHLLALMQKMASVAPDGLAATGGPKPHDQDDAQTSTGQELHLDMPARHIDGSLLKFGLERRVLDTSSFPALWLRHLEHYLEDIDGGSHTQAFGHDLADAERQSRCIKLAYEIVEYVLRPVL
ncbi:hypothetical protein CDD81_4961 [Ophiocordyceps australis]|uniref:RSE1/DDB1/CPSF1 first beta-propeller domain-containing protein n=1 Tax=Ophiocordyceps australis TaxID=1399860 RepID=A0A2C5XUL5_9HYPO|nr:hypothetical protein CDD81_4961 [Ophiocordyceps australis]